jgi:SsrA-binding protein
MPPKGTKLVAQNRKARHDYEVLETFEAGIQLKGSEVKSLRAGQVQLRDAFARVDDGEAWMHGVHIAPYAMATSWGVVDPDRARKLLLHKREIEELRSRTETEPLTIVPMAIYFKDGRAKVELALARGRKRYDKRNVIAQRDADREAERAHRSRQKGE